MRGREVGRLGGHFAKRGQQLVDVLARTVAIHEKIAGMKVTGEEVGVGKAVPRHQRAVGAGEHGDDGAGD